MGNVYHNFIFTVYILVFPKKHYYISLTHWSACLTDNQEVTDPISRHFHNFKRELGLERSREDK